MTLDDDTATWARQHAAAQSKSLSRYLGELLHRTMHESQEYEDAMQRFFSIASVPLSSPGTQYPKREQLYDRPRLR